MSAGSGSPEVAIIGGGIVGCAAAALLAQAGARVDVFERGEVAGAASGRNSGVVQHPFDPVLAELYAETVELYRSLEGFELPAEPAGVLMLSTEHEPLVEITTGLRREVPELRPELVEPRELEPALAPGLFGCRLHTGFPVRPAAAARAFARRAHAAGAAFHEEQLAWPWLGSGRARGVIAGGVRRPADAVLVTAGPWTPEVVDTTRAWQPIGAVWGVVVEVELADPPRHVVEEAGVEAVATAADAVAGGSVFSAVTAGGVTAVGSTFLRDEPDPEAWAGTLMTRGSGFLPALAGAAPLRARACARPQSADARPLLGEVGDIDGLWVAAGHGPWGISTGPASARLAVDALLGRGEIPGALAAQRFG